MPPESNISGNWPNYFPKSKTVKVWWVPEGSDFDPYAPKLSSIREYGAPLHFFNAINQIKEHDNMTEVNFKYNTAVKAIDTNASLPAVVIGSNRHGVKTNAWSGHVGGLDFSYKTDAARHIELALEHLLASLEVPALQAAQDKHKTEQLEAFQKAHEEAVKEDTAFLCSDEALTALKRFNKDLEDASVSWREAGEAHKFSIPLKKVVQNWITWDKTQTAKELEAFLESPEALAALEHYRGYFGHNYKTWQEARKADKAKYDGGSELPLKEVVQNWINVKAEDDKLTAERDVDYRVTRREELAVRFGSFGHSKWSGLSRSGQKAIDFIITKEIADGATK